MQSHRTSRTKRIFKNLVIFMIGFSWIFFVTRAFNITPISTNAIMFMKSIFLTASGNNASVTGIILDGSTSWGITITSLTGKIVLWTDNSGKLIESSASGVASYISPYLSLSGGWWGPYLPLSGNTLSGNPITVMCGWRNEQEALTWAYMIYL